MRRIRSHRRARCRLAFTAPRHRGGPPRRSATTSRSPSRTGRRPAVAPRQPAGTRAVPGARAGPHPGPAGRHHRLHRPAHRHHRDLGVRHLDLAGAPARLRRHRADRLLERRHPRRHLDPGRAAGHLHRRRPDPVVRHGPLGRPATRTSSGPPSTARATRWSTIWTDTFSHRRRRRRGAAAVVPAAAHPLPRARASAAAAGVRMLGAMGSNVPDRFTVDPERRAHRLGHRAGRAALLAEHPRRAVPRVRRRRRGLVLPTSTEMVVEYWGRKPSARPTVLGRPAYPDPQVDHAARMHLRLRSTTAPATGRSTPRTRPAYPGWRAVVTRLHSLDEVERFIAAGIPVVTSPVLPRQRAGRGELRHLRAPVRGRRLHRRRRRDRQRPGVVSPTTWCATSTGDQFEQIWLRTNVPRQRQRRLRRRRHRLPDQAPDRSPGRRSPAPPTGESPILLLPSASPFSVADRRWHRVCPSTPPVAAAAAGALLALVASPPRHRLRRRTRRPVAVTVVDPAGCATDPATRSGSSGPCGSPRWSTSTGRARRPRRAGPRRRPAGRVPRAGSTWPSSCNHNAVVVQVRPTADAFWPSPYEPWSEYLTGARGQDPGWDPLAFRGRRGARAQPGVPRLVQPVPGLHASTRGAGADLDQLAPTTRPAQHPDWTVAYPPADVAGSRSTTTPASPRSARSSQDAMMDAVTQYDIDGVHFDDYFYPYPVAGQVFDDDATYAQYGARLRRPGRLAAGQHRPAGPGDGRSRSRRPSRG